MLLIVKAKDISIKVGWPIGKQLINCHNCIEEYKKKLLFGIVFGMLLLFKFFTVI